MLNRLIEWSLKNQLLVTVGLILVHSGGSVGGEGDEDRRDPGSL